MLEQAAALTGIALLTVLATGLGALPVMALGPRAERYDRVLAGVTIGVMTVASVVGLLIPAVREGTPASVGIGAAFGAIGLVAGGRLLKRRFGSENAAGSAWLTFGVLFVHSFPEGLAIGSAFAAAGSLGTFVIVAIAVQNIPEGTATAAAVRAAGGSRRAQLEAAILSSAPQVPGALIAWLAVDAVDGLLPACFAAAGAAMFLLVATQLVPEALRERGVGATVAGAVGGGAAMLLLATLLDAGV